MCIQSAVNMLFHPICVKDAIKSKSREVSHEATVPLAFFIRPLDISLAVNSDELDIT